MLTLVANGIKDKLTRMAVNVNILQLCPMFKSTDFFPYGFNMQVKKFTNLNIFSLGSLEKFIVICGCSRHPVYERCNETVITLNICEISF